MEQLKSETASPSGQATGTAHVEMIDSSEEIRFTMAVVADLGSSAEALDLDSLCIGSGAVDH